MLQERVPGSFRDPSGFLFESGGILLRQVNKKYRGDYEMLMTSGLYEELIAEGLMVWHEEVDLTLKRTDDAFKIIRPERVPFVSYPYEWCFSALKDAALITLDIQKKALAYEMSLKDASAFNVQFVGGRPVFIDTLSFEKYREGQPWVAYKQFCMHFLAPLALMSYRDVRLSGLLKVSVDGFPLDLASELLPFRTKLRFSLLSHIHMHAKSQQRFSGKTVDKSRKNIKKFAMRAIIDSLENAVNGLRWSAAGTEWADYYLDTNYSKDGMKHKIDSVSDFLAEISPETVWDLGANDGTFSRIASGKGIQTISFDIDPVCIEQNYLYVRKNNEPNLLPLLFDAMNPTPNLGWANMERMSVTSRGPCDTLMALALIHHLAISNNVPFPDISQYFSRLCRWLIVEFVPKEDSQVQRLLSTREDIFPNYDQEHFEKMFSQDFRIVRSVKIPDSRRVLYLMRTLGKHQILDSAQIEEKA
ncbi:MAG: class I SAM-dependent methyltransferase [Deltaproteobacteria bacterium]|nr:class I SAM-dependent methyltransferase [Deltaproteobacteria bacterium]